ncbi:hypothetical protein OUZ56_016467 [Daphnia magna]|uniref:Uncharacterized protein n=1 Tax=Daphnia magna TaxID=35525 RepID=A0ABR0AQM8_9CRUS|nr:hypothetical protein OUZ56_016467 [Daphnia magna]
MGGYKKLSKWLVMALSDHEAKKTRESFQPKFKTKNDLLCNPTLDDAFYIRLKTANRGRAEEFRLLPEIHLVQWDEQQTIHKQ